MKTKSKQTTTHTPYVNLSTKPKYVLPRPKVVELTTVFECRLTTSQYTQHGKELTRCVRHVSAPNAKRAAQLVAASEDSAADRVRISAVENDPEYPTVLAMFQVRKEFVGGYRTIEGLVSRLTVLVTDDEK